MDELRFSRMNMLIPESAAEKLRNAHVAVFGLGGVGGHAAEALVRAGVGELTFIDNDTVSETNINRQLVALTSTVGKYKAEVMRDRALDINPNAKVHAKTILYSKDTRDELLSPCYTYIIDAIDLVTHKLDLICSAYAMNIPIISAMGTGNKLDASAFSVTDLAKTQNCPLARVMRKELKARGINHHPVVFSKELALTPSSLPDETPSIRRSTPGSVSWVPGCAGMILAGEVIRKIAGI